MGYGEYGGNGSIQVSNWLSDPEVNDCITTPGAAALNRAHGNNPSRLSARAQGFLPQVANGHRTSIGKDKTPADMGRFAVTVNFQSAAELNAALAELQAAAAGGRLSATFFVQVLRDTPGQVQIAWGNQALAAAI